MPSSATREIARIIGPGTNELSLGLELNITPNYLLYAKPYLNSRVIKDHIGYAKLPESYDKAHPGNIPMIKINPGLKNPLERIMTFQVDESQALMAILTIQEPTNQVKIRYLTFEAHPRRHPRSMLSKTIIPFQDTLYSYQLQIYGELVGILLNGRSTSCLHIVGWANGTSYGHLVHSLPAGAMSSFSFLTREKILTTNITSRSIDFWRFYPGVFQGMAKIAMPSIARGVVVENFTCTPFTPEQLYMLKDWNDLFIIFTLTMLIGGDTYAVANFVLERERLNQLSNYGSLAWQQWGGERVTCFDESDAKDDCNMAGSWYTTVGLPHAYGKPNSITVHEFYPFHNSAQEFRLSVDGVYPFTERIVQNLGAYPVFQGQLHCDRALVLDGRIFAIRNSPDNTVIRLYHF